MHPARRWMVFLSAAIAAVLAVALPAVNASAATRSAAGNRVGASHPQTISIVGVSHPVPPGQGRCGGLPQAQFAVGACVAAEDAGAATTAERLAASCGGASFTPGTKVLLASGKAVPIASLRLGEKVLATNVRTGKTKAEPVAAVLVHHDTNRYDLTVKTSQGNAVIHTTSNHLFWDLTQHKWIKAAALRYGDHLRTPNGVRVTAAGGHTPGNTTGWMWDLTVAGSHDFYVRAAAAAVLVHNCDITNPASFEGASRAQAEQELLNNGWQNAGPTSGEGGVRWRLPGNAADQVRIMPGNPADPAVIKQGPYIRFSIRGVRYGPFRLSSF